MFLNKISDNSLNLDNLVNESYEYLLETQNYIHELDMKMIKCEHHCIVNEDTDMMMLAEEEYSSKLAATVRAVWNKIVIKIQEFIISISNTINKFRTRSKIKNNVAPSASKINEILRKSKKVHGDRNYLNGYSIELNERALKDPEGFTSLLNKTITKLEGLLRDNDSTMLKDAYEDIRTTIGLRNGSWTSGSTMRLDSEIVTNAYEIIYNEYYSKQWIDVLKKAKEMAKKQANMSNIAKNPESAANATWFQRLINLIILDMQKTISGCIKICYIVEKEINN